MGISDVPPLWRDWDAFLARGHDAHGGHRSSHCPVGRFAEPDEIAAAVVFLASEEAFFITGTTLVIDRGLTAH